MAGKFHHEQLYRGDVVLAKLSRMRIVVCGAGALGSNLVDNLVRQGAGCLRAIDHDRVEEHNVSTQVYDNAEVGLWKVEALRNRLFRATGVEVDAVRRELTPRNASQLLKDADLVIDAFDNSASRAAAQGAVRAAGTPCLHVGLFADYGEVVWDALYRVPADAHGDVCDYPLARNLILITVAVAAEAVVEFLAIGSQMSRSITLRDMAIRPLEVTG